MSKYESKYERLTVKIIREHFWDPIQKKGKPIKMFYEQDYNEQGQEWSIHVPEWQVMTPTGTLIEGHSVKIEDWLSKDTDGPYAEDGKNSNIFYYLEFEEEEMETGENSIQIGWKGEDNEEDEGEDEENEMESRPPNNYMTMDALDGVDCWIEKITKNY